MGRCRPLNRRPFDPRWRRFTPVMRWWARRRRSRRPGADGLGRKLVKVVQRLLFWYTPQIVHFQYSAVQAIEELAKAIHNWKTPPAATGTKRVRRWPPRSPARKSWSAAWRRCASRPFPASSGRWRGCGRSGSPRNSASRP